MFDRTVQYPCAVASHDEAGVSAAIQWCLRHMQEGDTLTVWTALKSNLKNHRRLDELVAKYSDVHHVTGRGGGFITGTGPVLMAWPRMDEIAKLVQGSADQIRGLCVISGYKDWIRPWVTATQPEILGDGSAWVTKTPALHPVVAAALDDLTHTINHNNTIAAGFEKDQVVGVLLALHGSGYELHGRSMEGWALAHGWSGENPRKLGEYANAISAGHRPRAREVINRHYIELLRRQVTEAESSVPQPPSSPTGE